MPEGDELGSLNNRGKTFCSDEGKICAFVLFKDESHGIIPVQNYATNPIICQIHKCVLQLVPHGLFVLKVCF